VDTTEKQSPPPRGLKDRETREMEAWSEDD